MNFYIENKKIWISPNDTKLEEEHVMGKRSDGFRQFLSLLLTAPALGNELKLQNTILLIDEPEAHLHPQAQKNMKKLLIGMTKNENNNVVIYSTHSPYMIDQKHLSRCFRFKKENHKTTIKKIEEMTVTTHAEVMYEVYDVPSNDYHNELYGRLQGTCRYKRI